MFDVSWAHFPLNLDSLAGDDDDLLGWKWPRFPGAHFIQTGVKLTEANNAASTRMNSVAEEQTPGRETFVCNLCGAVNLVDRHTFEREEPSCQQCGSTSRQRWLGYRLTERLLGEPKTLSELTAERSSDEDDAIEAPEPEKPYANIHGIGFSDPPQLSKSLSEIFQYTNTFFHTEPKLDISTLEGQQFPPLDFILCSEVLEHVPPPIDRAFVHLAKLLKPEGHLLLTVPWDPDDPTKEHFPSMHEHKVVNFHGEFVVLNRTQDGEWEIFDKELKFHGGPGETLEIRFFGKSDLVRLLEEAGFENITVDWESAREFGVDFKEPWSRPIYAQKRRNP
jgi:SAM-dependent methyltransferase